jgi:hypothetical protein
VQAQEFPSDLTSMRGWQDFISVWAGTVRLGGV